MQNAITQGDKIRAAVINTFGDHGIHARGRGMMIGFAMPDTIDLTKAVDLARDEYRLIINVTGGNVIRLLPALTLSDADTQALIDKLCALIGKLIDAAQPSM